MSQQQMQSRDRVAVRETSRRLVYLIAQLEDPTLGPVEREELADQIAGFSLAALIWMRKVPGLRIGNDSLQLLVDVKTAIQMVGPLPGDFRDDATHKWMSAVARMVFRFWMPLPDRPMQLPPGLAK